MDQDKIRESLADFLLDHLKITRVNRTHVWVDNKQIGRKQFIDENLTAKTLQKAQCAEVLDYRRSDQDEYFRDVLDICGTWLRDQITEKYVDKDIPEISIDRTLLVPVLDLKTDDVILFNKKTRNISEMSYKAWERKLTKEERAIVTHTMRDALLTYDPYNLDTFVPFTWEGMEVLKVNTYVPPPWRTHTEPSDVEMPDIIWDLLEHLFPTDEHLNFVLNWMYLALIRRNETYLVLNGAKGIGKGVFCQVLAALVGKEHSTEAPLSLLTTHFNSSLDRTRLIIFDEQRVGKTEHNKLKRYINKYQNIEKKGVDADRATEIYNSYVISNNDITDMYIETDDRRFSVPDMIHVNLEDVMPKESIDWLVRELEDEDSDLVREMGYYIYKYGKSVNLYEFSVLKGVRFWQLAYNSLKEWQKFLVDKIMQREETEYRIKSLGREFSKESQQFTRFPRNYLKVDDFLKNYRHLGSIELGTVEKSEGEWCVIPADRYFPEEVDSGKESIL